MSYENMTQAELIAALLAKDAALKVQANRKLTLKVSEKGAVSLYGMNRFPTTLYGEQWLKVLDHAVAIREFIVANQSLLSTKVQAERKLYGEHAAS